MPTGRIALWAGILILAALALFSYLDPGAAAVFAGPELPDIGAAPPDPSSSQSCDESGATAEAGRPDARHIGLSSSDLASLPSATDPSIAIALPPWNPATTAPASIAGRTQPDSAVSMRLLRTGAQVGIGRTVSDYDGAYLLYAGGRSDCRPSAYDWRLLPGDTVEVTAGGKTTSTRIAAPVIARLDAPNDRLTGESEPGRSIEITLYQPAPDNCAPGIHKRTVIAGGDGAFSADFGGQVDIKNNAWATACIPDAGGNGVCWTAYPYRLETQFGSRYVRGYAPFDKDSLLTIYRQNQVLTATNVRGSKPTGKFEAYVGYHVLPGDRLELDLGSHKVVSTLVDLNAVIDLATDRLYGWTAPGRALQATVYPVTPWLSSTPTTVNGCEVFQRCVSGIAGEAGSFDLALPFDAQPGANALLATYDSQGNVQRREINTRAITAYPGTGSVDVEWPARTGVAPGSTASATLRLSLYDPQNNLKREQETTIDRNSHNIEGFWLPELQSGDHIVAEATDGSISETMVVGQISAHLERSSSLLTVQSGPGRLIAMPYRTAVKGMRGMPDITSVQRPSACVSSSHSGGVFEHAFPAMGISGAHKAYAVLQGADGHYTATKANAFGVSTDFDALSGGTARISGGGLTAGASVQMRARLGGIESTRSLSSSESGNFSASLTFTGPFIPGDRVEVSTGDGDHYVLDVGALVPPHPAGSDTLVCGKMPGPGTLTLHLENQSYPPALAQVEGIAYSGATGEYCVDLTRAGVPVNSAGTSLCLPIRLSSPCASTDVEFLGSDGHSLSFATSYDSSPDPDPFETDNDYASASVYTGPQRRTLTWGDSDWVRFTVPPGPAGGITMIRAGNMGMGADVIVSLYADGQVLLENWHEPNPTGEELVWRRALAPGTYILNIKRPDPFGDSHCAFTYDLLIAPATSVFLPVLRR